MPPIEGWVPQVPSGKLGPFLRKRSISSRGSPMTAVAPSWSSRRLPPTAT
jgi:hypothetical protein